MGVEDDVRRTDCARDAGAVVRSRPGPDAARADRRLLRDGEGSLLPADQDRRHDPRPRGAQGEGGAGREPRPRHIPQHGPQPARRDRGEVDQQSCPQKTRRLGSAPMALAEASRLTQPLPGGQEGATVRIHPINTGHMLGPEELLAMSGGRVKALRSVRSPRDEWLKVPAPVFLLEHPGAGPILVDTGLHASVSVDPKQKMGGLIGRLYRFESEPDQTAVAQLRKRGFEPGDIKLVVMTHMHMDHASAISDFTE